MPDLELVSRMTISASSCMEHSTGLPRLTGPVNSSGDSMGPDDGVDHIVHVAERSRLTAVSEHGNGLVAKGLDDECRYHAAVVGHHARAVRVEYTGHLDAKLVLPPVVEKQGFGAPLAFVVAGSYADGIHMAPVVFGLRVHLGIAVYLAGGCLEYLGPSALGQSQHVDGSMHAGLGGHDRVELIVDGRGRAGQVVYFVDFHVQRECYVVSHDFEIRVVQQVSDIPADTGIIIVHAQYAVAEAQQPFAQMGTQESGSTGNQNAFFTNPSISVH